MRAIKIRDGVWFEVIDGMGRLVGAWWVWEVLAQHDVGFQLFGDQPFGRV